MKDLPGTPEKLVLDGNTFFYMADADPAYGQPEWQNNGLPHSGGTMRQMVRRDTGSTGHTVKANGDELQILKSLQERPENFPIAWYNRAGDCYRCTGFINFDTASAQNGSVELALFPENDWTFFGG
ncbi:MAG: hypothetical protein LBK08_10350 [Treponema sp.]|jgi:hypothetical protein|nr:hypothetical protein [Treponema sp.]